MTVIIPAFNAAEYLQRAIESAVITFGGDRSRVIVVDDGSRDSTFEIASQSEVRTVRHRSNKGIASAINTGIALATTPYVAWLSADDSYAQCAQSVYGRMLRSFPEADIYFGKYLLADHSGKELGTRGNLVLARGDEGPLDYDWLAEFVYYCPINGSTVIMKKQTVLELGLFDTRLRYSQDHEFWLRMAYHRCKAVFTPAHVGIRHVHAAQLSQSRRVRYISRLDNLRFLRLYLGGSIGRISAAIAASATPDARRKAVASLARRGLILEAGKLLLSK